MLLFAVIIAFVLLLIFYGISLFNTLIKNKAYAAEAYSGIDVQLKKRYDLIPNLLSAVKGYVKHKDSVFLKVTEARTRIMSATTAQERFDAENMLSQSLKSLFAVSESYPTLKSDTSFLSLQQKLYDIEQELEQARRYYNAVVRNYNILLESFPSNVVARMFGFGLLTYFELDNEEERKNPEVKLD
ncbi:membrane protein [Porphyromonas macacae]|uniref:LemA family protein n=1 Tax=Porphyromonas macacae TaxID=28115 RepID=UPI00052E116F|nr:LemA family protein [Porphyromonas macacae]KGO00443.1 membrane protein [Porphyromonas macacae]